MLTYVAIALIVFGAYFYLKSRGQKQQFNLADIKKDLDRGAILLDVRTAREFNSGHAKGAKNVSLQTLQAGALPTKDTTKTVYVYCHSGARASSASSILKQAGFQSVVNIGSLGKWRKLGGAVTH